MNGCLGQVLLLPKVIIRYSMCSAKDECVIRNRVKSCVVIIEYQSLTESTTLTAKLYEAIAKRYSIMNLGQVLLLPQSYCEKS